MAHESSAYHGAGDGARPAAFRAYTPPAPLSDFVEKFWLCEGDAPPHAAERRLPTGTAQLVISLGEEPLRVSRTSRYESYRGAAISGPHSVPFLIHTASQASLLGVAFRPGGVFPFFGLPAGEIQDAHVSLDALWGGAAEHLRERLLAAATPEARFLILEHALLARLVPVAQRHPAVAFALREFRAAPHTRPVAHMAEHVGLSQRRFIQVFREEVGLTPKLFCRVRRFQRALRRIGPRQSIAWARLASDCGYFDQSHLIRDFRAFSGLTPTAYLARRSEHQNHVPLAE